MEGGVGDLVTPAHSHTRLWGGIATPPRLTHLPRSLFPSLFRGRKWIRFCEKAQGPDPSNILSVFYIVISDLLTHPRAPVWWLGRGGGGEVKQKKEMKCVRCLIDFRVFL